MTIAARVNWWVYVVVHDEAERLGTVQAQTYPEAYQEAARQFGVSPECQSRLFVRPIDRRVGLRPGPLTRLKAGQSSIRTVVRRADLTI
jgi:hypothetical protein